MQDLPGAPGTARQGRTRTIVSTNDGGKATQPRAPGHERPRAAQRAARHGRLSAALRAPGADVPLAMTAGAPGQHCLSAAPRAPGHERPLAAQRAAGRDRLSAALPAPGADVPLATTARAPGQHCLSAALQAPGADRPLAIPARAPGQHRLSAALRAPGHGKTPAAQRAARHDRLSAALPAPDDDALLAATASLSSHHRPSAASIATVSLPAGLRRLRQECLPRVPANPRTLIYPHSHRDTAHSRESGNPRPPVATGGPPGGHAPATCATHSQAHTDLLSRSTTHQVHPAIQVPPHPRSCSTACTGLLHQHPSRAPPRPSAVPLHSGGTIGGPEPSPSPSRPASPVPRPPVALP